jgi:hypothetical protein
LRYDREIPNTASEKSNMPQPRYSKEEHARRGEEIYAHEIAPQVEEGNQGRIVAIDIDSGAFEIAEKGMDAASRLLARLPNAQIWCVKVGSPAVHRFGPRPRTA